MSWFKPWFEISKEAAKTWAHNSEINSPLNAYDGTCIFSRWLTLKNKQTNKSMEILEEVWLPVLQSALFFGQGKNISPALKLSPRQTNHQNKNKQTLPRLCAHWIHIHNGILKSIQWNASEVTGINVKTSAGDSSRTKADWPRFSARTAMTVQDSLPAQSNAADDRLFIFRMNASRGSWCKYILHEQL